MYFSLGGEWMKIIPLKEYIDTAKKGDLFLVITNNQPKESWNWEELHIYVNDLCSVAFLIDYATPNSNNTDYLYYYDLDLQADYYLTEDHEVIVFESADELPETIKFFCIGDHCKEKYSNIDSVEENDGITYNHYIILTREQIWEAKQKISKEDE